MVQLGPYYSISEWWIHLAIFWNFSEGGCPKLEFLWALILQHVNQNKWLRFKTNHGSHFCSNWTKTKRKQKQSGDYIQGIYGRDCICTGNWFGDFRSGWAKLARQGCRWLPLPLQCRCPRKNAVVPLCGYFIISSACYQQHVGYHTDRN